MRRAPKRISQSPATTAAAAALSILCFGVSAVAQPAAHGLSELVPEEAAAIHLTAAPPPGELRLSEAGDVVCREFIRREPPLDSPLCAADGYALQAGVTWVWTVGAEEASAYRSGPVEVWSVRECGSVREAVERPTAEMIEGVAPWRGELGAFEGELPEADERACRDERLALVFDESDVRHDFLEGRHQLMGPIMGESVVEATIGGSPALSVAMAPQISPRGCGQEGIVRQQPFSTMEIQCRGDVGVVRWALWRNFLNRDCDAQNRGTRSIGPELRCVILPGDANAHAHVIESGLIRIDLNSGETEDLVVSQP